MNIKLPDTKLCAQNYNLRTKNNNKNLNSKNPISFGDFDKKVPNNPKYWQNLSFCGKKKFEKLSNEQKIENLEKLLREEHLFYDREEEEEFLDLLKNKNGKIDDEHYELGKIFLKNNTLSSLAADNLKKYNSFGAEAYRAFSFLKNEVYNSDEAAAAHLDLIELIFDKKSQKIDPENKKFIKELAQKNNCYVNNYLLGIKKDDGGIFKDDFKEKIFRSIELGIDSIEFSYCYNFYQEKSKNKDCYGDEIFELAVQLAHEFRENKSFSYKNYKILFEALEASINPNYINYLANNKIEFLDDLKQIREFLNKTDHKTEHYNFNIDELISKFDILDAKKPICEISQENRKEFIFSILKSSNSKELTPFETTIAKAIPDLKKMPEGLELAYSKNNFLNDLEKLDLNDEIFEKLSLKPIVEDGKIVDYEGLISLNSLDKNNPEEKEIYNLCHKFLYENSVKTKNEALNLELNKIIKAFPEFLNIVGKKEQGKTYPKDIDALLTLAHSIKNPAYKKLKPTDKFALKTSCLLMSVVQNEPKIGKNQKSLEKSNLLVRKMINKIFFNKDAQDRIFELVKNRNWLEDWNDALYCDKEFLAQDLAFQFRRPNDFDIALILAKSSLKAKGQDFYKNSEYKFDDIDLIQEKIDKMYQSGNLIFSDFPLIKSKLNNHIENLRGVDYKVINFRKIKPDEDLYEYGFEHKTKKDVMFLVHMIKEGKKADFETLEVLSSSLKGGVLSQSLITPFYQETCFDNAYGVILSGENTNIISICEHDQDSGFHKPIEDVVSDFVFYDEWDEKNKERDYRTNFRNFLIERLLGDCGIETYWLDFEDFAEFYKNIASKTSLNQILDTETYEFYRKKISGKRLKNVIIEFQKSLMSRDFHNEIVGYVPKIKAVIAKEEELEFVPQGLLDFAHSEDLPIVLV